jgi:hypothetical protein
VHVFVHQLGGQAQLAPTDRIGRQQRRAGKDLVDVMHDDGRLDDDLAVMHQGRNDRVRVELHVSGVELVAAQREQLPVPIDVLLGQSEPRLDRAHRSPAVVEGEHASSLIRYRDYLYFRIGENLDPRFGSAIHRLFAFKR